MPGLHGQPEPGYGAEFNRPLQPASSPTDADLGPSAAGAIRVPEAISFRQLASLHQGAIEAGRRESPSEPSGPDASPTSPSLGHGPAKAQARRQSGQPQAAAAELAELDQLLAAYEQLGQRLLQQLGRQGTALEQHRHPQQVMALGALGAHIRMGLQALAASRQ
jgi:hypothetical protein